MREIRTSGSMSGDGKRSVAAWPKLPRPSSNFYHRVESLRCEGSDAIGAKRTCRERRERVDLTKMTHNGHQHPNFAVMHNLARMQRYGRV